MKRVLCIGIAAALACSCGRNDKTTPPETKPNGTATTPASATPAGSAAAGADQTIVLTGCLLREPGANSAIGTSGSQTAPDRDRTAPTPPATDRFVLVNARAGSPDSSGLPNGGAGVGASGAGASGGPLVNATDSYVLEGSELIGHEKQEVRVTGRLVDAALTGGALSGSATSGTTGSAAAANDRLRHVTVDSITTVGGECTAR